MEKARLEKELLELRAGRAPMLWIPLRAHAVWESMDVTLACTALGSPVPQATWYDSASTALGGTRVPRGTGTRGTALSCQQGGRNSPTVRPAGTWGPGGSDSPVESFWDRADVHGGFPVSLGFPTGKLGIFSTKEPPFSTKSPQTHPNKAWLPWTP